MSQKKSKATRRSISVLQQIVTGPQTHRAAKAQTTATTRDGRRLATRIFFSPWTRFQPTQKMSRPPTREMFDIAAGVKTGASRWAPTVNPP